MKDIESCEELKNYENQLNANIVGPIEDVTGLTRGALIYSPELDLNAQTKPFAVVRSLTDTEKITTFNATKEAEYYIGFMFIPY